MPVVVYTDQVEGLDPLLARLGGHKAMAHKVMVNVLRDLSMFIKAGALKNFDKHSKTRNTLHSIDAIVDQTKLMAVIGVHNIAGLFIEKGTKAHPINVRRAKALMLPIASHAGSFSAATGSPFGRDFHLGRLSHYRKTGQLKAGKGAYGQQVVFRKSVHHPGNKAMPFLFPAYKSSTAFREARLKMAGEEITKFLAGDHHIG